MKITWDEPKRLANIDKHDLDFADIHADFFFVGDHMPRQSKSSYGHRPASWWRVDGDFRQIGPRRHFDNIDATRKKR